MSDIALEGMIDMYCREKIFGNSALTTALLDRLTHRSRILIFRGESHRFRESRRCLEKSEPGILEDLSKGGNSE